jgi:hypothetical protein
MSAGVTAGPPETTTTSSVRALLQGCSCGNLARTLQVVSVISVNKLDNVKHSDTILHR